MIEELQKDLDRLKDPDIPLIDKMNGVRLFHEKAKSIRGLSGEEGPREMRRKIALWADAVEFATKTIAELDAREGTLPK